MLRKIVLLLIVVIIFSFLGYFIFRDNVMYIQVEGFSEQEQELKNKYSGKKSYSKEELDEMTKEVMELNDMKKEKLIREYQESMESTGIYDPVDSNSE